MGKQLASQFLPVNDAAMSLLRRCILALDNDADYQTSFATSLISKLLQTEKESNNVNSMIMEQKYDFSAGAICTVLACINKKSAIFTETQCTSSLLQQCAEFAQNLYVEASRSTTTTSCINIAKLMAVIINKVGEKSYYIY